MTKSDKNSAFELSGQLSKKKGKDFRIFIDPLKYVIGWSE